MREVNATEAKARLAELLRSVEFGEAVATTRHGKAIAHLIPAREHESDRRKRAVARFREARRRWRRIAMSTEDILAARHEGRPRAASAALPRPDDSRR